MSGPVAIPVVTDDPYLEMDGPVILLAGPGTGKTYQLARRIQSLVDTYDVAPDQITVITFTREAARGMRNKLKESDKPEYVEAAKRPKNILTMHSLGFRIIEENARTIGLEAGVVVVSDPLLKGGLMRDAALRAGLDEVRAKAALKDKETANVALSKESLKIHDSYNEILRACNAVDFDDQISLACEILEKDSQVLQKYKELTKHLLVDEYQDINADQNRFIKLLTSGQEEGLFAVGDDDQSIYGFRGGEPKYIRSFSTDYPNAKVLQLQTSRRCLKNILDCAIALVSKYDSERSPKASPKYTEVEPGLVKIWNCPSESREATLIAKAIYAKTSAATAKDFFVLVPNRNYVKPISQALTATGVAHEVGTSGETNEEWDQLVLIRKWLQAPSHILTRHVIELILCSGTTGIPGVKVRRDDKIQLRHDYNQEIAELWTPVIAKKMGLRESLTDGAKTSARLAEFETLLQAVKDAFDSDDTSSFVKALRESLGLFKSIGEFYKCLNLLKAGSDDASGGAKNLARILTWRLQGVSATIL
jgi:superfamily I DNA/RNA helicase